MKKLYILKNLCVALGLFLSKPSFSQSVNYQFYLDANNNCTYDASETLLYNLPGWINFTFVNTSSSTTTYSYIPVTCPGTFAVSSPSLPAANSFSLAYPALQYPYLSLNNSCSAYSNLSYTTTSYLPVTNVSQMSDVLFSSSNIPNYYWGNATGNVFPVCFNPDSCFFSFQFNNLYTCNSSVSTRTYSVYFDGTLIDQFVFTGLGSNLGSGTNMALAEFYQNEYASISMSVKFPSAISILGSHTFSISTSNLYPGASISYSCTLNSVPCTKIKGNFYNDCNMNCSLGTGDALIYSGVAGLIYQSATSYSVSFQPNVYGQYSCFIPYSTGNYSLTSYSITPKFTPCSTSTVTIPPGGTSTTNFGYTVMLSNSSDPMVLIQAAPSVTNSILPGGGAVVRARFFDYLGFGDCSGGGFINPGKLKIKLDKNFSYLSPLGATPAPNSIISNPNGDTLVWNISDFYLNFSTYEVLASVSSSVSVNTSTYYISALITPSFDINSANSLSDFVGVIGVPFDPNEKISFAPGIQANGDIPLSTQYLYYTINFQNTGTAPAVNVTLLDTLDSNLDWSSLEVLSSSFPVQSQRNNSSGQCIFYFQGINLPDSNANEPASHGYVNYRIKLDPNLLANTIIKNRAHIYFDYNPPIATNQTQNKLVDFTGVNEVLLKSSSKLLPNPFHDKLLIEAPEEILSVEIMNSLGQILVKKDLHSKTAELHLSELPNAIYFINIKTKSASVTAKAVKN